MSVIKTGGYCCFVVQLQRLDDFFAHRMCKSVNVGLYVIIFSSQLQVCAELTYLLSLLSIYWRRWDGVVNSQYQCWMQLIARKSWFPKWPTCVDLTLNRVKFCQLACVNFSAFYGFAMLSSTFWTLKQSIFHCQLAPKQLWFRVGLWGIIGQSENWWFSFTFTTPNNLSGLFLCLNSLLEIVVNAKLKSKRHTAPCTSIAFVVFAV